MMPMASVADLLLRIQRFVLRGYELSELHFLSVCDGKMDDLPGGVASAAFFLYDAQIYSLNTDT